MPVKVPMVPVVFMIPLCLSPLFLPGRLLKLRPPRGAEACEGLVGLVGFIRARA